MTTWQKRSQALIFVLAGLAAWVAGLLSAGRTAWPQIVAYWLVLTGKNVCDLLAARKK